METLQLQGFWDMQEFAIEGNLKIMELGEFAIARILRFVGICNSGNFENCGNWEILQLLGFWDFWGFAIERILVMVRMW